MPSKDPAVLQRAQKRYYAKNVEKIRENARKYGKTHRARIREARREYQREYKREYRTINREKELAKQALWREKNREKLREKNRRWMQAHPEVYREASKIRRVNKNNAPLRDLTREQWETIQASQDHRCAYCGKRCKGRLSQDHITPLSKGGSHTLHNVIAACRNCNSRKRTGPPLKAVQPLLL